MNPSATRSACNCFRVRRCLRDFPASDVSQPANLSAKGSSLPGRTEMANIGSTGPAFRCFLTVLRDSPVRRAISRIASFSRSDIRRIKFKSSMLITPLPPAASCLGGRVTWVNSQWKLRAQMGHFWVEINKLL